MNEPLTDTLETAARPPLGPALAAYARAQLARAQRQLSRGGSRQHSGIHQARKSLRRVRAVLALTADEFGKAGRALDRDIRAIVRALSLLRDTQSVLDSLDHLLADTGTDFIDPTMAKALRNTLRHRRDGVLRLALLNDPDFQGLRERIRAARAGVVDLPWSALTPATIATAQGRTFERLRTTADKAQRRPDPERRHRWRRRLRRLNQQGNALSKVGADHSLVFAVDTAMLDLLARHQDLHVLQTTVSELASIDAATLASLRAAVAQALPAVPPLTAGIGAAAREPATASPGV